MKILRITVIYPTTQHPDSGTYVADQVHALAPYVKTKVVSKSSKSWMGYLPFALKTLWALLIEEYDIIHAHYGFHSALLPVLLRLQPLVVTFHGSDALIEPDRNRLYRLLQKWTVRSAAQIIAVSRQIQSRLIEELGADPKKISIISSGVDTQAFRFRSKDEARKRLRLKSEMRVALFIGRLTHAKGVDLIEEASRQAPEVDFYFIGEGPMRWKSPNCFFVGLVEHAQMPDWLNAADVLLLPSRSEGTPVAVLESLASEIPVICTGVGACPELIVDGVTGFLIPNGDAQALIDSIKKAFSGMKFDTARGRQMIVQHYDLQIIAKKLHTLYSGVLEKQKKLEP